MKKILISITLIVLASWVTAQETKHQTQELESILFGNYLAYLTQQDDSGNYEGGIDNLVYKLLDKQDYRVQPGEHKEVIMLFRADADKPEEFKNDEKMYLPDHPAFPITYIQKVYEGNEKMQKDIGYAPRINSYDDHKRLVFLDGRIFILQDWVDKDNYTLVAVMEHQAKKVGGLKKMKMVMKSPKKMKTMQPHTQLQNYLDKAYKKQQEIYPKWLAEGNNGSLEENTENIRKLIIDVINKQRTDWMNSEEYKRIKERNRHAEQNRSESTVTINNSSGKDVYIYVEGSKNSSRISTNGRASFSCKSNLYYSYDANGSANSATLIVSANQNCGEQIQID
ncbi:hypothetical protein [Sediminicola luteus]|uniref:Uncharacterized protein n=1 Tax=Sediminicola luteus TaxID=319238 RepID=A0A2A4G6K9_9FLAO|nr:hypothetical protein [Sediminicola luteus]PCE64063.1 hypothetical protein B7P33_12545 [Sediminicola luteus]